MFHPALLFIAGIVCGALLAGLVMWKRAAGMMLMEDPSTMNFADTVRTIQEQAEAHGWKLPKIHEISNTVNEAGYDVLPVTVIELCKADIAGRVLADDAGRRVASMMPCRVAVYETSGGDVVVSRMNSPLMSRMFGGIVQEAMTEAAVGNEELLASVLPQ